MAMEFSKFMWVHAYVPLAGSCCSVPQGTPPKVGSSSPSTTLPQDFFPSDLLRGHRTVRKDHLTRAFEQASVPDRGPRTRPELLDRLPGEGKE